jgi:molybdenum cofactor synthesis domain-containing protein
VGHTAAIITVSDRVSSGEAEDRSGPAVAAALADGGFEVVSAATVADEADAIAAEIRRAATSAHLVVTTGGTGLGPRDHTPEATTSVADYLVPGIAEEMRRAGRFTTPMALLSRAVAGVVGRSLVINLPGSASGALESLEAVADILPHALDVLGGADHPR